VKPATIFLRFDDFGLISHLRKPCGSSSRLHYVISFLNNQPDALIIPNLFCYKILHVSGIFFAHHQEFSTVHSAPVSFTHVFDDRFEFHPESAWKLSSET